MDKVQNANTINPAQFFQIDFSHSPLEFFVINRNSQLVNIDAKRIHAGASGI